MSDFKVEYLTLNTGDLDQASVGFYEVDFNPVVYVNESKLG